MPEEASPPPARNVIERMVNRACNALEGPVVWFRETIVTPNQKQYPWYHEKFRRVPTIDQCYMDDPCCYHEANIQFKRDKLVDNEILSILRQRFEDCVAYETPDHVEKCTPLWEYYQKAEANWFSKYGDLGFYGTALAAFMKQKHRMIWERRHGKIGSGRKDLQSANDTAEN